MSSLKPESEFELYALSLYPPPYTTNKNTRKIPEVLLPESDEELPYPDEEFPNPDEEFPPFDEPKPPERISELDTPVYLLLFSIKHKTTDLISFFTFCFFPFFSY